MAKTLKKTVYGRHAEIEVFAVETLLSLNYEVFVNGRYYSKSKTLAGAVAMAEELAKTR